MTLKTWVIAALKIQIAIQKYIFKYIKIVLLAVILNCNNIYAIIIFTVLSVQINAALLSIRDFFIKKEKRKEKDTQKHLTDSNPFDWWSISNIHQQK